MTDNTQPPSGLWLSINETWEVECERCQVEVESLEMGAIIGANKPHGYNSHLDNCPHCHGMSKTVNGMDGLKILLREEGILDGWNWKTFDENDLPFFEGLRIGVHSEDIKKSLTHIIKLIDTYGAIQLREHD